MLGELYALRALLIGDTAASTIAAGSPSGSVVQLGSGAAAGWQADEHCYATGTGATAANQRLVRRVSVVDTSLDRLTLDPALPATPASGDALRRGVYHWIQNGTLCRYEKPRHSSPVEQLIGSTQPDGAVLYGLRSQQRLRFDARLQTWEVRSIATAHDWAAGLMDRLARTLDHQTLAVTGALMVELAVDRVEERQRDDELFEQVAILTIARARAVA